VAEVIAEAGFSPGKKFRRIGIPDVFPDHYGSQEKLMDHYRINADGVTSAAGTYRPTAVADEGLAAKLGISLAYLRRLREQRPDLWDANVNGWLHGNDLVGYPPDDRSFLVRLFQAEDDNLGVARALLSDSYKVIDNLDALMATLDGIRQAGVDVQFDGLDLTERRLYARVVAPQVRAWAPVLLAGYRSPFGSEVYIPGRNWTPEQARAAAARDGRGYKPGAEPVMFAGFEVSNSEVGDGAWTVTPRIVAQVCGNGMLIIADVARAVHLGAKHEDGVVRYTADTLEKELALITARTRDAVATFLSPDYLQAAIATIERQAGIPVHRPEETVRAVSLAGTILSRWDWPRNRACWWMPPSSVRKTTMTTSLPCHSVATISAVPEAVSPAT